MEMNKDSKNKSVSVLQCDGLLYNRILERDPSSNIQSFHLYHQRIGEVPFEWELIPGTPKNLPDDEEGIPITPPLTLTPPPSVLNSIIPKPRIDCQIQSQKESWILRKIKILKQDDGICRMSRRKRSIIAFGESEGEIRAFSDRSYYSSTYGSSNSCAMELSNISEESLRDDARFCCNNTPWNITLILDEENKKVYYCREHRTAFTHENSIFSKIILTSASSLEEQSFRSYYRSSISDGVPFEWEKQPGTPIHPPEIEAIPPPSPPPALQSCGLSLPKTLLADDDDHTNTKRRPLISFFGAKSMEMLQNNNNTAKTSVDVDKESPGNLHVSGSHHIWKSKRLSKFSGFSNNPFAARFCFKPRTLS